MKKNQLMEENIYAVVGQYDCNMHEDSALARALIAALRQLGEVSVFNLPRTRFADEIERDASLSVHHYAAPGDDPANAAMRLDEMVRDILMLGVTECYVLYEGGDVYAPFLKAVHKALRRQGVKVCALNRRGPFHSLRKLFGNLFLTIRFHVAELKWQQLEEEELANVEGFSGHGSIDGFRLSRHFDAMRNARRQILAIRKHH